MALQHLRSSTANKRPTPAAMSDGQLAINTEATSPGLFFKNSSGDLVKVGPVHVGTTAPNVSPAAGGQTGNTLGEQWLDTTGGTYVFKVWDGSAWRSETGTFVDVNGDTMTGALGIIAGTAGAPGLFISGDTNTGIYSPGADQLAVSTGGTGRLTVSTTAVSSTLAVDHPLGAVGTPSITFTGDLNTGFWSPTADTIAASTGGSERLRIDSSGRLLIGTSTSVSTFGVAPRLQIAGNESYQSNIAYRADAFAPFISVGHSRDATVGSQTILQSGDDFGTFAFVGSDGVGLIQGASIKGQVDGTPGANDMPGRLVFSTTADGASSPTERARIDSSGRVGIGTASPTDSLHVAGGGRFTGAAVSLDVNGAFIDYSSSVARITGQGSSGGTLAFYTNPNNGFNTERARITSGGDLYIGQSTNPATSRVVVQVQTGTANGVNAQITSNTGTSYPWSNYNASGTYVGGISCTSTATSFPTSSDYRLKQNVQPLVNASALIAQLKPSTFEFKEDVGTQVQGFIAHELQEVVPLAVIGEKDAEDANGNPIYQGVDAAKLVPLLTAALQEAIAKIETLEAKVAALEAS